LDGQSYPEGDDPCQYENLAPRKISDYPALVLASIDIETTPIAYQDSNQNVVRWSRIWRTAR
jgi:hypothetical protein